MVRARRRKEGGWSRSGMGSGLGEIRRFDTNTDTEIAIGRVGYPSSKERAKQRERVEERGSVTGQTRTRRNRLAITERKRKRGSGSKRDPRPRWCVDRYRYPRNASAGVLETKLIPRLDICKGDPSIVPKGCLTLKLQFDSC